MAPPLPRPGAQRPVCPRPTVESQGPHTRRPGRMAPEDAFCLVAVECQHLLRQPCLHPGQLAVGVALPLHGHDVLQRAAEHGGAEHGVLGVPDLLHVGLPQPLPRQPPCWWPASPPSPPTPLLPEPASSSCLPSSLSTPGFCAARAPWPESPVGALPASWRCLGVPREGSLSRPHRPARAMWATWGGGGSAGCSFLSLIGRGWGTALGAGRYRGELRLRDRGTGGPRASWVGSGCKGRRECSWDHLPSAPPAPAHLSVGGGHHWQACDGSGASVSKGARDGLLSPPARGEGPLWEPRQPDGGRPGAARAAVALTRSGPPHTLSPHWLLSCGCTPARGLPAAYRVGSTQPPPH